MQEPFQPRSWKKIAPFTVAAVLVAGIASGWLSGSGYANPWFAALRKPAFTPPGWVFAVVWPILYVMLGIAWAMILALPPLRGRKIGLRLFYLQLILNFLWSPLFFAVHDMGVAKYLIVVIVFLTVWTGVIFFSLNRVAGRLLIPYLAWLLFASALNVTIERLNPAAGSSILTFTEAQFNAVRKENDRRSGEGNERPRGDDRWNGPGGEKLGPRESERLDRDTGYHRTR